MVAFHLLQVALLVRIQTPQPEVFTSLICFAVKGGGEVKKKHRCLLKRFATLVAALLMICCMTAPTLAVDMPASPSSADFRSHPFSWYVWRSVPSSDGVSHFELISSPITFDSNGYISTDPFGPPYDMRLTERKFVDSDGSREVTFGFPNLYELSGECGSWRYYPSFPVGHHTPSLFAYVKLYPKVGSTVDAGFDASVLESNGYCAAVCPSPEYYSLTSSLSPGVSSPNGNTPFYPMLSSNQSVYPVSHGPWKSGSSYGNRWYALPGLDDGPFALPSNSYSNAASPFYCPVLDGFPFWDSFSDWQDSGRFPKSYSFPSSVAHAWVLKKDTPAGDLNGLRFIPTLVVPVQYLPADVSVGDWISQGSMDKLQDQLVKDFDVNSDTLKNSKQDLESWQNSNTIDTDIADIAFSVFHALFGTALASFVSTVVLLCFGAVVLRILLRKALE